MREPWRLLEPRRLARMAVDLDGPSQARVVEHAARHALAWLGHEAATTPFDDLDAEEEASRAG